MIGRTLNPRVKAARRWYAVLPRVIRGLAKFCLWQQVKASPVTSAARGHCTEHCVRHCLLTVVAICLYQQLLIILFSPCGYCRFQSETVGCIFLGGWHTHKLRPVCFVRSTSLKCFGVAFLSKPVSGVSLQAGSVSTLTKRC